MNNSDQLRKLARQSTICVSMPTLVALIVAYLLLVFGHIALAAGAIGFAVAWLLQATHTSLRYIKRSEDGKHAMS